jgi:hypothetical protein
MSVKKAMQTYSRQGGTSSIFVHDDGLQATSDSDLEERMRFYEDHGSHGQNTTIPKAGLSVAGGLRRRAT